MKFNKKAVAGAGLGVLALVGGTFAYYNQTVSLDNPLQTPKYGDALVEEFTPPTDNLQPGQNWNKDVWATNTGDAPLVVRIRMVEKWTRKDGETYKILSSAKLDENENVIYNNKESTKDDRFKAELREVTKYDANQEDEKDGLVSENDDSVVLKKLVNVGLDNNEWIDGNDGYWYWNGVLEEGASSLQILDELILANNMDIGIYEEKEYYAKAETEPAMSDINAWTLVQGNNLTNAAKELNDAKKENPDLQDKIYRKAESIVKEENGVKLLGYSNSNYVLTIYSEFVQATKAAVIDTWGEGNYSKLTNVTAAADGSLSSIVKLDAGNDEGNGNEGGGGEATE